MATTAPAVTVTEVLPKRNPSGRRNQKKETLKVEIREPKTAKNPRSSTTDTTKMQRELASLKNVVRQFKQSKVVSSAQSLPEETPVEAWSQPPTSLSQPVTFSDSGRSDYLRCIFCPEDGPADIPDDVMEMHSKRMETVTYNIPMIDPNNEDSVAPVGGLIIFYPSHPSSLVGYVYVYSPDTNEYTCIQRLTTAQSLANNYDYARRVSQKVSVRSTTLPAGAYEVNGVINAVYVDGVATEFGWLDTQLLSPIAMEQLYDQILASTTNPLDKIGNVGVLEGVTLISLPPTLVQPFHRLGDPTSTFSSNPQPPTVPILGFDSIFDISGSLEYFVNLKLPHGTGALSLCDWNQTVQVDSSVGVLVDWMYFFNTGYNTTTEQTIFISMKIEAFDPFNNSVGSYTQGVTATLGTAPSFFATTQTISQFFASNLGPIGYLKMTATHTILTGIAANLSISSYNSGSTLKAVVPNGAITGSTRPVAIVAFQNLDAGTSLAVTGVTNFELIPNANLRQNLETTYGHYDPNEIDCAKYLLQNRTQHNIRTVYASNAYEKEKGKYREFFLCEMTRPQPGPVSASLGLGDFWRFAKKKIFPALAIGTKAVVPGSAPFIDAIGKATGISTSNTMRNYWKPRAYTGVVTEDKEKEEEEEQEEEKEDRSDDYPPAITPPSLKVRNRDAYDEFRQWLFGSVVANHIPGQPYALMRTMREPPKEPRHIRFKQVKALSRSAAFPTITLVGAERAEAGHGLYIAVYGNHTDLAPNVPWGYTNTPDGYKIYGLQEDSWPFDTKGDVTVMPINPIEFEKGRVVPYRTGPPLMGHSCDAAVWLVCYGTFRGVFPTPITGSVVMKSGRPVLEPLPKDSLNAKLKFLHSFGIPLIANNPQADLTVSEVDEAVPVTYSKRPVAYQ